MGSIDHGTRPHSVTGHDGWTVNRLAALGDYILFASAFFFYFLRSSPDVVSPDSFETAHATGDAAMLLITTVSPCNPRWSSGASRPRRYEVRDSTDAARARF
jgi:hypothetical protein